MQLANYVLLCNNTHCNLLCFHAKIFGDKNFHVKIFVDDLREWIYVNDCSIRVVQSYVV